MESKKQMSESESLCANIHAVYDLAQKAKAIKDIRKDMYLGTAQSSTEDSEPDAGMFSTAHFEISGIDAILRELIEYINRI